MTINHNSTNTQISVAEIKKYLDRNPIAHRTCSEMWKVNIITGRSAVEKAFKTITGYGVKEYLVLVRLEYTKRYLREGMPIKRVAAKSLYRSQSAYCTAFKRYFKQTPTEWLREQQ
ncbi:MULTISPECIES: helix-turn-helix domain-containing protein [Niastella]|uniref:Helix-turn-helix domain-containing protein n=1 Tax=Niastella soli TaxID=2821487 RepID=A0ABS3YU36_9BACT|nr:helix-turn-helix domain-containing protein [Niastella soli]MBO9201398.1 helix-turn-helix domain-containing protein [Niastella soli]